MVKEVNLKHGIVEDISNFIVLFQFQCARHCWWIHYAFHKVKIIKHAIRFVACWSSILIICWFFHVWTTLHHHESRNLVSMIGSLFWKIQQLITWNCWYSRHVFKSGISFWGTPSKYCSSYQSFINYISK